MAVVQGINETDNLEGDQTIVASEPTGSQVGPDSLSYQAPEYLNSQYTPTPKPVVSAANGSRGLPNISFGSAGSNALRDKLVSAGMRYIGQPYSWGNLDCSGLVQRAYAAIGIHLPRISYQQANAGKRVGLGDLSVGDLVAWDDSSRNPGADHIAIFIGYDAHGRPRILEAPHTGANVRVRTMSTTGFDSSAWGVQMNVGG